MSPGPGRAPAGIARATLAGLFALVALEVLWETALAPLPTGRGWLALKALPLALLVPGTARGATRPRQVLALLLPWYVAEGLVRAYAETGRHAFVAAAAATVAAATFVCLLAWFRRASTRGPREASG